MRLLTLIAKNNPCYKAGKKMKAVKGLMLHSTGANNPKLSRYVGPDDGLLGKNPNNNHWNQAGMTKCVHGFIGKLKDGSIATYRTLPWDHRGWHGGGKSNDTHIGIEICEDDLKDPKYFKLVYQEAVEVFAHLAKLYKLDPMKHIIDHSEGYKLGIASNHGDVMHWFPKYGKSMDTFRKDVKAQMEPKKKEVVTPAPVTTPKGKTIAQLADEVLAGLHGSGRERKLSLGDKYDAVQREINKRMSRK